MKIQIKNRGFYDRSDKRVQLLKEDEVLTVIHELGTDQKANEELVGQRFSDGFYCNHDAGSVFVERENCVIL